MSSKQLEVVETADIKVGDVLMPEEYDEQMAVTDYDVESACLTVTKVELAGHPTQTDYLKITYVWPDGVEDFVILNGEMKSMRLKKPVEKEQVNIRLWVIEKVSGDDNKLATTLVFHGDEPRTCECGDEVTEYIEDEEGMTECLPCLVGSIKEGYAVVQQA